MATDPDKPDTFADRLNQFMTAKGFNQSTLSDESGIERTCLNRILKGRKHPDLFQIGVLAKCFKVSPDELMAGVKLPAKVQRAVDKERERIQRVLRAEADRDEAREALAHVRERLEQEREEREREREQERLARVASEAAATEHLRNVEQYAVAQRTSAEEKIARLKEELREAVAHLSSFEATAKVLRGQIAALQHQLVNERSTKAGTAVLGGLVGIALGRAMD
jgi:transcriptional regulator with XRE-family HTH domain